MSALDPGKTPEQLQLFDAGPEHGTCAAPGCTHTRRRVQGAKYCEEHATMVDGVPRDEYQKATCARCGGTFGRRAVHGGAARQAWLDFCGRCRDASPLSLTQLGRHRVPAALVRAWLVAPELRCDLCTHRLHRGSRPPAIDHDRDCCPGKHSCGRCVRGVLCFGCNGKIAAVEELRRRGVDAARLSAYLNGRPAGRLEAV